MAKSKGSSLKTKLTAAWKDPVGSKLISAGIITAIGVLTVYLGNFGPWIAEKFQELFAYLGSEAHVARWLFFTSCLGNAAAFVILIRNAARAMLAEEEPQQVDYTRDTFLGIVWRWQYSWNETCNVVSFCPSCDYQISAKAGGYYPRTSVLYVCDECNRKVAEFYESKSALDDKIVKLIQQKLRNGTWREQVKAERLKK